MVLIFQSTRPVRGATDTSAHRFHGAYISIHAPRAGRDGDIRPMVAGRGLFQSTRPVRGATARTLETGSILPFQSTRPVRGATSLSSNLALKTTISIHAPRAGRDRP